MVKERFVPYGVEAKVKLVCIEVVGIGSLSVIHVEQREIFKHAVLSNALQDSFAALSDFMI